MNLEVINNHKHSLKLYGLENKLNFLIKLYEKEKIPKVLMLTGLKGIGKSTLVNHFMHYIYDKENYDLIKNTINDKSNFHKQFCESIFPNIIYLAGDDFKNIKIDDIRNLKSQILKSIISNKERYVILDDVELFNVNSLNALLKIIEEPSQNNFFILINNKSKSVIETIHSRSLEFKINLTNKMRIDITKSLIENFNLDPSINYEQINLTPGNFLIFNDLINKNKLDINGNFFSNFEMILNLYKKTKYIHLINFILFLTDYYFYCLKTKQNHNIEKIIENKSFVIDNINKFFIHNLNQNSLINAINNKLSNE